MAAERLKNVAPGASPGVGVGVELSPGGAKDPDLSPLPGLSVSRQGYPGFAPGATFLSRSAAGTVTSAITKMSKLQSPPFQGGEFAFPFICAQCPVRLSCRSSCRKEINRCSLQTAPFVGEDRREYEGGLHAPYKSVRTTRVSAVVTGIV